LGAIGTGGRGSAILGESAGQPGVKVVAVCDVLRQRREQRAAEYNQRYGGKVCTPYRDLREMLAQAGSEHNLDVDLLFSLVKAESGGHARAVSRAGARGLMQLMPLTASDLGVRDSFNPKQNLFGGSTYLNAMLLRYHDNLALALAAYNAGPAAVDRYRGVPPYRETRAYVARVIHEFNRRVVARKIQARQTVASAPQGAISR
jgi:soluble lytic murein transglycosylase-like protein